jgi:hypothetical protein
MTVFSSSLSSAVTGSDLQINHFWFTNELRMTNHLQMKKEE